MLYICLVGYKIRPVDGYVAVCLVLTIDVYGTRYLSVRVDHRAEKLPGTTPSVHPDHTEDLEKPEASECRGCKHLAPGPTEHDD